MKKLFVAIRRGNLDEVAALLDKKPELISCLAKAPPKKDDGQSPLMVAIKSDNPEVAHLLLDRGADVNFADAVNPYGANFSAPIWYDAVGQCFLRAGDHVSQKNQERTKGYFLLLRRLLDLGMDPNRKTSYGLTAWQHALEQYDKFARDSYPSYYVEGTKAHNRQLREMLKAVLDELLKHGADIHDFRRDSGSRGLPAASIILRNAEEGRELLDGLYGLDPDSSAFQPYTMKYRGKERLVTPSRTVEDYRQEYEIQWRELEPILRAYYA